ATIPSSGRGTPESPTATGRRSGTGPAGTRRRTARPRRSSSPPTVTGRGDGRVLPAGDRRPVNIFDLVTLAVRRDTNDWSKDDTDEKPEVGVRLVQQSTRVLDSVSSSYSRQDTAIHRSASSLSSRNRFSSPSGFVRLPAVS